MSLRSDLEKVSGEFWQNGFVSVRPVKTQADLVYAAYECRLTDAQKEMVNPGWFSIGRAYLFPEDNYPCVIENERKEPIGFISLCKWLGSGDAYSWSYFIDVDHQGKGYGKQTALLAIQIFQAANPAKPIKLATEAVNTKAQRLYLSLGFRKLPEMDGDDLVFGLFPGTESVEG